MRSPYLQHVGLEQQLSVSQDTPSTDKYRGLLERRLIHPRYWMNSLPTHTFVHGPGVRPDTSARGLAQWVIATTQVVMI